MSPLTILVVDDQPIMREVVSQILEDEGHNVRVASDGVEALRKLGHARYDLLVTDVVMPGMDGIELISESRRRHPMLRVIAMSAGDGLFSKINCLEIASRVGAGAVLTKPFERADLAAAIEELCPSDSFALR
jgi:CheY-like chemotaxis protein